MSVFFTQSPRPFTKKELLSDLLSRAEYLTSVNGDGRPHQALFAAIGAAKSSANCASVWGDENYCDIALQALAASIQPGGAFADLSEVFTKWGFKH